MDSPHPQPMCTERRLDFLDTELNVMAHLQQRTPAWHLARQGKLTASNLGAALGQVSYISRVSAFRRAVGTEKFEGNVDCEWGTKNEANGIMDYQTLTGNNVVATGLHLSPDHTAK